MDSLTYLQKPDAVPIQPVYVLHGEEGFLKRQVSAVLQRQVLGEDADSFGLANINGEKATIGGVLNEVQTLPFLAVRRLVFVENADPFVTKYRAQLEKYVSSLDAKAEPRGVLVLDVKTWPSNTRLYKMLDAGAIACKPLPPAKLPAWCVQRATALGKQLTAQAAELLVELVGTEMGLLDQELAKLAVYVGEAKRIDADAVDTLVGRSRTETIWRIFDAVGSGQVGQALGILNQVLDQGDDPMAILGGFSWQLRRLAQVYRLTTLGRSFPAAISEVGAAPHQARAMEQQLRALGRKRAEQLYDWLVEIDIGLKGDSQLPGRLLLERLLVRMGSGSRS